MFCKPPNMKCTHSCHGVLVNVRAQPIIKKTLRRAEIRASALVTLPNLIYFSAKLEPVTRKAKITFEIKHTPFEQPSRLHPFGLIKRPDEVNRAV